MTNYESTLTRLNMAVNVFKKVRFELSPGKAERLIFEQAVEIRDAADKFIAAAKERKANHAK